MALTDDLLRDIRYRLVQGLDSREEIFTAMVESHAADDLDPAEVREAIELAFAAKAKAIESWPTVTDNDKLLAAFAALDENGILTLESPGLTQEDGVRRAVVLATVRKGLGTTMVGFCFFTFNDMARAIEGGGLSLAYGTFEEEAAPVGSAPTPEQKIGAAVVAACRAAGLAVEWTGADEDFIELPRFHWQRRFR